MAGERASIFGQLIEKLEECEELGDTDRKYFYDVMLEVLEEFDVKGMDQYLNIDPSFDEAYEDRYPELEDEDD